MLDPQSFQKVFLGILSFLHSVLEQRPQIFDCLAPGALFMPDPDSNQLDDFLMPRSKYHGEFTPQNLAFNANLQEFAQRVALICALETGGKS